MNCLLNLSQQPQCQFSLQDVIIKVKVVSSCKRDKVDHQTGKIAVKSDPDHVLCLPEKRITDPIQITVSDTCYHFNLLARSRERSSRRERSKHDRRVELLGYPVYFPSHIQERGGQETTEIDIHGPDSVNSTGTIEDLKS